jgi:hypothetical protein
VRIQIAGEQLSYFERFGYVELQSLLHDSEVRDLQHALAVERAKQPISPFGSPAPGVGDMAITSEEGRRVLCSSKLGEAAFAFVRKKPIRYAFDRLWPSFPPNDSHIDTISSISPVLIAIVIALETKAAVAAPKESPFMLTSLPSEAGSVLFISPKTALHLTSSSGNYLVVGYSGGRMLYGLQPQDPCTHTLKRYGYVFGDRLVEATHPVVYR